MCLATVAPTTLSLRFDRGCNVGRLNSVDAFQQWHLLHIMLLRVYFKSDVCMTFFFRVVMFLTIFANTSLLCVPVVIALFFLTEYER